MQKFRTCFFMILLLGYFPVICSQHLSAGIKSGINFSDIHGNYCSGKWKYKSGASETIFINYSINKVIGIQTGVNLSTLYYEHLPYTNYGWIEYQIEVFNSYNYPIPIYYRPIEKMDFTMLSIPVLAKVTIPSKPSLSVSAGAYYSFLTNSSLEYIFTEEPATPNNDFGFLYSAGISYPLNENMDILFDLRYMTGRRMFLDYAGYRHGAMEISFGVAFKGFVKKNSEADITQGQDSISSRISLSYVGGINISGNYFRDNKNSYSPYIGYSAGFQTDIRLSDKAFFRTGLSFERTGYSLKDSSDSYHRYHRGLEPVYSVDTKTVIDYVVIPAQLGLRIGESRSIYIAAGPYMAFRLNSRCTGEAVMEHRDPGSYYKDRIIVYDDLGRLIRNDDIGWMIEGGVTIPLAGKYSLDLGLQYQLGSFDIFNESFYMSQEQRGETVIRNRVITLKAGVDIPVFR